MNNIETSKQHLAENSLINLLWSRYGYFKGKQNLDSQHDTLIDILRHQPENSLACNDLGVIAQINNETELAIACFEQAIKNDPDPHPHTFYNLAVMLIRQKQFAKAQNLLLKAVEKQPEHSGYLYELGINSWHLGRKELATECFEKRLKQVKDCHCSLYYLGLACMESNEFIRARSYFYQIVESKSNGDFATLTHKQIIRSFLFENKPDRAADKVNIATDKFCENRDFRFWQIIVDCFNEKNPVKPIKYREFSQMLETLLQEKPDCAGELIKEFRIIADHIAANRPMACAAAPIIKADIDSRISEPVAPQEPELPVPDDEEAFFKTCFKCDNPEEFVDQHFIFIHQAEWQSLDHLMVEISAQVAQRTHNEAPRQLKENMRAYDWPETSVHLHKGNIPSFRPWLIGETFISGPDAKDFVVITKTVLEVVSPPPPLVFRNQTSATGRFMCLRHDTRDTMREVEKNKRWIEIAPL